MHSRRLLTLVAAFAASLLVGANGSSCAPPRAICTLECEHGLKHDSHGRAYCECRESEVCIAVVPPPARNPQTGECTYFPSVCDVPEGFTRCGPGCRVGDRFVPAGHSFPADDGCNTCTCLRDGSVACTDRACPVCIVDGRVYQAGETFPAGDGCNICTCTENRRVVCTLRPCPQCPPPPEQLCEQTGGRWDPGSCGHYRCGEQPLCEALIPGCDCGPGQNFREGLGCVRDPACERCESDADCKPGSICNECPPDPNCPACTVCGPPRCEPIVCSFDDDCPKGSHCEGSSVCPPDVVCIWEGEPGICVPDDDGKCCDPALQPGTNGLPFCFEGASCCADGHWACNQGDGTPSCGPPGLGEVCR